MKLAARTLIAGALLLASATAQAQEIQTIRVSTIPIIGTTPLQVAIEKGFFEEAGIKVDATPIVGGAVGLPALAAGAVQVAFSNSVSVALGAAQGLGFTIISAGSASSAEPPDISGIVSAPGAGITSGADLNGKRLAVNTRNNIIWLYARAWIDATGGDSASVTYLEVPFPQMVDAITGGQVDAAFLNDPFLTAALSAGTVELVSWPYHAVSPEIPVGMYVTTDTYLAENPEVIAAFVAGYNKAVEWSNENAGTQEWLEIVSRSTRIAAERLEGLPVPPFPTSIDVEMLQSTIDLMVRYDLLRQPISASTILHETAIAE